MLWWMNSNIAPVLVGGVGEINFGKQFRQGNRVYDANSIAMALLSQPVGNAGGNSYLYMIIDDTQGFDGVRCYEDYAPSLRANRSGLKVMDDFPCTTRGTEIASTLRASMHKQGTRNLIENLINGRGYEGIMESNLRIRKLTPKECYRLMGFDDIDHDRASAVVSNSQLYKQAGNSIVVPVIGGILNNVQRYL